MEISDRLIYKKSNNYRLHADILRWALLGGYAAFFGATIKIAENKPAIGILLFIISLAYILVLAVQNWFYNLFALFVKECEYRIANNLRLRPLEEFAQEVGPSVNPFHPAFFFALFAVVLSSVAFLSYAFGFGFIISSVLVIIMYVLFSNWFKNWNKWVYLPLIEKYSNLYRQDIGTK